MKYPAKRSEDHIFLSFCSIDKDAAELLKDALTREGYEVWWSPSIQCAGEWHGVIDEKLNSASCIIVLWTTAACTSDWVRHEASIAMATGKYAPAKIGAAPIGPPYDRLQAADVSGATLASSHPGLCMLMERVTELLPEPTPLTRRVLRVLRANVVAIIAVLFGISTALLLLHLGNRVEGQIKVAKSIPPAVSELKSTVGGLENRIVGMFKPKLGFAYQFGISATNSGFLAVENSGTGTATIDTIRVRFNGDEIPATSSALESLARSSGFTFRAFSMSKGDTFAPGGIRTLYQIPAQRLRGDQICPQDKARKRFFEQLEIDIVYTSSSGLIQTDTFRYDNTNTLQC
jgi:hypothetical protein